MATIQGVALPTISQGQALARLKTLADETLPSGYGYDYSGPARQFIKESGGLVLTFFFAIVIIFLALAAQFESFRDPIIILVSVPMSIAGALIFINLGIGVGTLALRQVGLHAQTRQRRLELVRGIGQPRRWMKAPMSLSRAASPTPRCSRLRP